MIRPQTNAHREAICLDGLWFGQPETESSGDLRHGLTQPLRIAVPGSWNEQLAEHGLMNHTGGFWYQREVFLPERASARQIGLHFASADYSAQVFVDGVPVGRSGPPMLPFAIDITPHVQPGQTFRLSVRVDATLPEHGPMQAVTREDYVREGRPKDEYWPAVRFDFFPFGGLNRSVHLTLHDPRAIEAVHIATGWNPENGADLTVFAQCEGTGLRMVLDGQPVAHNPDTGRVDLSALPDLAPWSPGAPNLHDLVLQGLDAAGGIIDEVAFRIGFRTLRVVGQTLFLNGAPITLRGFGKHEDSPIHGRGVNLPQLVKDFGLLRWIGANSVRTSHYPYDESFLDMADEQGILVISELFSVNLDFRRVDTRDLTAHKASVDVQFARDGHHASVVAWSLSNEPGYLGEAEYREQSGAYWQDLFAHARALDPHRPMTVANVQYAGIDDPAFSHSDFITINRYFGWYTEPGQLDRAAARLRDTLDTLSQRHGKPLFLAEFGADAVAGFHATTDQLWTEDFQSDFISAYWDVITHHPACVGGHVWNFADFRTAQHGRRAVLNHKGVFTRTRDPKRAAFTLRTLWNGAGRT
jgi:beta-glucuronidase